MSHSADDIKLQNLNTISGDDSMDLTDPSVMSRPRRVLVAVDGSKASNHAFNVALSQTSSDDKITIYHGEYLGTTLDVDGQFTTVSDPNNEKNSEYLKNFYLGQCRKANRDCEFVNHKISGGPSVVSKDICDVATRKGIDNVYLGSRGLSMPTRFLLGSVSWSLLNSCDCNITIVKDQKAKEKEEQTVTPRQWRGHSAIERSTRETY